MEAIKVRRSCFAKIQAIRRLMEAVMVQYNLLQYLPPEEDLPGSDDTPSDNELQNLLPGANQERQRAEQAQQLTDLIAKLQERGIDLDEL